jgi:hypothetical protein
MAWEEEEEKAFKEIKRVLTNAPALGLPDVIKPFFPICTWKTGDSSRSLDPDARFLTLPSGVFIKAT